MIASKRGQIGKLITSIPVMIGIMIIMTLFLVLSFQFSRLKQPEVIGVFGEFSSSGSNSVLWDVIEFKGKKMFVWEAFVSENLVISREFNSKLVGVIADKEFNGCFVLAEPYEKAFISTEGKTISSYNKLKGFKKGGNVVISLDSTKLKNYFGYLNRVPVFVGGKEKFVVYYQGRCLDE